MPTLPRHIEQLAPDRLVIHGGSLTQYFGGAIFFLIGIAIHWLIPSFDFDRDDTAILCRVFGTIPTVIGIVMLCGRSSTILDITQRTITKKWGILFPFYVRESPIISGMVVTIYDNSSTDGRSYPVLLHCGRTNIRLYSSDTYDASYDTAAVAAVFLNTSLRDTTTEPATETLPALLNKPLHQQLRDSNAPGENTASPPAMLCKVVPKDAGIEITLPRFSSGQIMFGLIILVVLLLGFPLVVNFFLYLISEQNWKGLIICGIIPFILVRLIRFVLPGDTTITVNTGGITIAKCIGRLTKRTVIAAADIISLDHSSKSGITVKTQRGSFKFAGDLSPEEVQYLYTEVTRALASGRGEAILGK